jgi:hypothetical protein
MGGHFFVELSAGRTLGPPTAGETPKNVSKRRFRAENPKIEHFFGFADVNRNRFHIDPCLFVPIPTHFEVVLSKFNVDRHGSALVRCVLGPANGRFSENGQFT